MTVDKTEVHMKETQASAGDYCIRRSKSETIRGTAFGIVA